MEVAAASALADAEDLSADVVAVEVAIGKAIVSLPENVCKLELW